MLVFLNFNLYFCTSIFYIYVNVHNAFRFVMKRAKIGKCVFNDAWLSDPEFKDWIGKTTCATDFRCIPCCKSFSLSNMGVRALNVIEAQKQPELLKVIKPLLLLSHGTANVESGFSINKDLIDDNQSLDTLVALRLCKDGLRQCGGLQKFEVNKSVLAAIRGARTRYENDHKSRAVVEKEGQKRKQEEEVAVISAKVKRLSDESAHLLDLADKAALECERKSCLKKMAESNALRMASKAKKSEAEEAKRELDLLKNKYK